MSTSLTDTFAFERSLPPTFPPRSLLLGYSPELAAMLDDYDHAMRVRGEAVAAFRSMLPGGRRFNDVLAADRRAVVDHLLRDGSLPDPARSPIVALLTTDAAVAYAAAQHASWAVDAVAAQVPVWLRANGGPVIAAVSRELDERRDAIAELLVTARDRKDLHAFLSADKALPQWRERNALYRWLLAPDQPYRVRPDVQPGEVALLRHEAYGSTHDQPQAMVPDYTDAIAQFEKDHPRFANHTYEPPKRQRLTIGR